jgi:hypothetical protein
MRGATTRGSAARIRIAHGGKSLDGFVKVRNSSRLSGPPKTIHSHAAMTADRIITKAQDPFRDSLKKMALL